MKYNNEINKMKKYILLLSMLVLFIMTTNVSAQEWRVDDSCCYEDKCCVSKKNFYGKIFGGVNFLQNTSLNGNRASYKTGYVVSASLGYCWCYGLCLEAEYAYRRNEISKIHFFNEGSSNRGHFQTSSCMANLLWNMPLSSWGCSFWNIQPFIGAGLGCDFQQMHSSNSRIRFSQKWDHFSWQVMTGLSYPIFCNTELSLEYKFHQGGSHFNNHSLGVGLAYKFNFFR